MDLEHDTVLGLISGSCLLFVSFFLSFAEASPGDNITKKYAIIVTMVLAGFALCCHGVISLKRLRQLHIQQAEAKVERETRRQQEYHNPENVERRLRDQARNIARMRLLAQEIYQELKVQ